MTRAEIERLLKDVEQHKDDPTAELSMRATLDLLRTALELYAKLEKVTLKKP